MKKLIIVFHERFTDGDVAIYLSTTGSRFALNYSAEFSKTLGPKNP